ncbi:hypothetical protein GCM10011415_26600 [Salipiger pallidus]|uniref:Antifreeze glycopeptide polyprotein n=1 Tax=Salipiger pallidus TaxID=1775170 RepID=A0A8J2ZL92_9RHOB|nr:hypothetical protein [Salipiger pallidus]GGG76536.1 hypothetical protein GCM10011415_26600 [Salipiger pallidus]
MRTRTRLLAGAALGLGIAAATGAMAQERPARSDPDRPMSVIDWLDEQASGAGQTAVPPQGQGSAPANRPGGRVGAPGPYPVLPFPRLDEPPVASSGTSPAVEVLTLGDQLPDAVGLLPMSVTGLPRNLWRGSEAADLVPLIGAVEPAVPALSALLFTLLLAEADAPHGSGERSDFLAARLDRLLEEGAIDPGLALAERANGSMNPEIFARWFDLALLAGSAEPACETLDDRPSLADDMATRVYCDARMGNWDHAATVMGTANALGQLSDRDAELLTRFLDPDLVEGAAPVVPPAQPTPLQFRLFEAVGEALPTQPLPREFAAADLSGNSGWRAQIIAAERLAARGAVSANRLLGIYTDRRPAASGGIWDRVAAVQALESALATNRPDRVGPALVRAWPQMRSAGLLVPFSELFGEALADMPLEGRAAGIARNAALLGTDYELAAKEIAATGVLPERLEVATGLARGEAPQDPPDDAMTAAVSAAWSDPTPPPALARMLQQGRLGEAVLRAMALFDTGAEGNYDQVTDALAVLRSVGLEDTARRAALQLLLLDAEGALR